MTMISTPSAQPGSGGATAPPAVTPMPLGGVLWALGRKEARELAAVLAVSAAGYGAVLALALRQAANSIAYGNSSEPGALNSTFMQSGVVVAALAGLLVGFFQFFGESRPERLGFMLHRPVSRSTIFGGKVLTGVALYLAALALPLLVALWWASNPHNLPLPFSWRMALAPGADILSGIPYYFAGILVARRTDARWIGSRLLPAAAPVIASVLNIAAENFGGAVLGIGLATLVTATAAHGYFTAAGQYPRLRVPARAATGTVVLAALLTAGLLSFGLLEVLTMDRERSYSVTNKQAVILEDGTAAVEVYEYSSPGGMIRDRFEDLSGKVLGQAYPGVPSTGMEAFRSLPLYGGNVWDNGRAFHEPTSYFAYTVVRLNGDLWSRAKDRLGGDYLVGFEQTKHERVGAIGANGLEAGVAVPAARFAKPLHVAGIYASQLYQGGIYTNTYAASPAEWKPLLAAGDTIYMLQADGKLETFYKTPKQQPIAQFFAGTVNDPSVPTKPFVSSYSVAVTDDAVTILSSKAEVLLQYALPGVGRYYVHTGQIWGKAGVGNRFVLLLDPINNSAGEEPKPVTAVYFKPDGTFDHQMELPVFASYVPAQMNFIEAYIGAPLAPPVGTGIDVLANAEAPHYAQDAGYWRQLMLTAAGTAVVSGAAALILARRRRMRRGAAGLWTVAAVLFGPAGVLLMLCLPGLPVLARCGACGRPRPVDQERCPDCGTAAAAPVRNGTEIFVG